MKLRPWIKWLMALVIFSVVMFTMKRCQNSKIALNERIIVLQDSVRLYKTLSGKSAATARRMTVTSNQLLMVKNKEIDRLKAELSVKPKHIRELVEVEVLVHDTVYLEKAKLVMMDSTFSGNYVYEDDWNYFQAWVEEPTIGLFYSIRDSLSFVTEWHPRGFFKSGFTEVKALSSNPTVQFTGMGSFEVPEKKNRFDFGLQAGYGVNVLTGKAGPYVGVGIKYRPW